MSINPLLTNYNTLSSGSLFIPSSGTGGGGGGGGPAISSFGKLYASSIVLAPTDGTGRAIEIQSDPSINQGAILFTDSTGVSNLYSLLTQYNGAADQYDLAIDSLSAAASGNLIFGNFNGSINAPNMDLNISTINGAKVQSGAGAVLSVASSAFKDVLVNPSTGNVALQLGTKQGLCPPVAANPYTFTTNNSVANAGIVFDFNNGTNPGYGFDLASLGPGWYQIYIDNFLIQLAQSGTNIAYPGSVIQHFIEAGTVGDTPDAAIDHTPILVTSGNTMYPQSVSKSVRGVFYQPAALGTCTVLRLKAYFNSSDGAGSGTTGTWSYGPSGSLGNGRVILSPLLNAP